MSETKSEIVDLAERLIRSNGYDGFSYGDIAKALKIKNAAIHYYFPSKSDLGVAVIKQGRKHLEEMILKGESGSDAKKKLLEFIKIYSESHKKGLVCFMGALGPAYDNLPANMQMELTLASREIRFWVRSILKEGKVKNQLKFEGSVESLADTIITSVLASLILNKVTKEDVLSNSIDQIMHMV